MSLKYYFQFSKGAIANTTCFDYFLDSWVNFNTLQSIKLNFIKAIAILWMTDN